jgi:osmotically-inducible protein OsmY
MELKTDKDLQMDVVEELQLDPRLNAAGIGVAVERGVVTITGKVNNLAEKWTAERVVNRLYGVKAVANELEVRLPLVGKRTDADIARTAAAALEWDRLVPADRIDITVSDGWITLEGKVDREHQKVSAQRDVGRLTGVRGVSNLITVTPEMENKIIRR